MKDNRAKCTTHKCTRKVGTKCNYCSQYTCGEHSLGVGKHRMCHRCLEELKNEPGSFNVM